MTSKKEGRTHQGKVCKKMQRQKILNPIAFKIMTVMGHVINSHMHTYICYGVSLPLSMQRHRRLKLSTAAEVIFMFLTDRVAHVHTKFILASFIVANKMLEFFDITFLKHES